MRFAVLGVNAVPPVDEVLGPARDRRARDRRVQLGRARGEQHLAEVEQPAGEAALVGVGHPVGDERGLAGPGSAVTRPLPSLRIAA